MKGEFQPDNPPHEPLGEAYQHRLSHSLETGECPTMENQVTRWAITFFWCQSDGQPIKCPKPHSNGLACRARWPEFKAKDSPVLAAPAESAGVSLNLGTALGPRSSVALCGACFRLAQGNPMLVKLHNISDDALIVCTQSRALLKDIIRHITCHS